MAGENTEARDAKLHDTAQTILQEVNKDTDFGFVRLAGKYTSIRESDLTDLARTYLRYAAALSEKGEKCKWTLDSSEWSEIWESDCGESWSFMDDGPTENRVKFCHGCGKAVEVIIPVKEDADDE